MEESNEAFQFLFTIIPQKCTLKVQKEWTRSDLQISWKRGERRKSFPFAEATVNSHDDDDQMEVDFVEGCQRSMLVTLYQNAFGFEEREYLFILEEINGPIFKRLALHPFNVAEYVSMNCESFPLTANFKPLSQSIGDVSLVAQIRCEFLKKGSYRDSDMASNFSHISDSKSDCESEEDAEEINEHVALMQSRAKKTRTQWLNDLDGKDMEALPQYNNIPSYAFSPPEKDDLEFQTNCLPIVIPTLTKSLSLMNFDKKKVKNVSGSGDIMEIVHNVNENDFVESEQMQIQRLKLENEALKVKNAHLLSLVDMHQVDVKDLQEEIGKLHILVQDLKHKLQHANPSDSLSSTNSIVSCQHDQLYGWLCKQGGRIGRWKRRWFSLEDRHLCYYKYPGRRHPQGFIDLDRIIGVMDSATQDKNNGSFNILTREKIYQLTAYDEDDKRRWINMLDDLCTKKPRIRSKVDASSTLPR